MTNTTLNLPPPVAQQFAEKMLSTPMQDNIHSLGATPRNLSSRSGNTLRMRKSNRLQTAPVPVNPLFMNPPPQQLSIVDIDARINWYSTYTIIVEEVTATNEDPVLNYETARLGQSMRETEDELMKNLLESSASQINCSGGVNGDNPTEPALIDFTGVVQLLRGANADFITSQIGAEDKFGTSGVRDAFFCLASTDLITRLESIKGFIHKVQYPSDKNTLRTEWGSISNIRLMLSSAGSVTSSASLLGADIYNMFIIARESYSAISLEGSNAEFIYHPKGHGDDPSSFRQTAAWKFAHARAITQQSWVTNLRSTV